MLNEAMDEVVLVKGWKKGANWSFPRGKINKDEKDLDCAIREVYEETGFDIKGAGLVRSDEDAKFIEVNMREQQLRLYVFRDVPMDTLFEPRTRKEISKIQWYKLSELPTLKKSKHQHQQSQGDDLANNANKFYMVAPFLVPLKKWISQQKKQDALKSQTSLENEPIMATEVPQKRDNFIQNGVDQLPPVDHLSRLIAGLQKSNQDRPVEGDTTTSDPIQMAREASNNLKNLLNVAPKQQNGHSVPSNLGDHGSTSKVYNPQPQSLIDLLEAKGNVRQNGTANIGAMPQTPFDKTIEPPQSVPSPHHPHFVRQSQVSHLSSPPTFPYSPNQVGKRPVQKPAIPTMQFPPSQPTLSYQSFTLNRGMNQNPAFRTQPLPSPAYMSTRFDHSNYSAPAPYQRTGDPQFAPTPQFSQEQLQPSIPPASDLPVPKLNSHSSALLNIFKSANPLNSSSTSQVAATQPAVQNSGKKPIRQELPSILQQAIDKSSHTSEKRIEQLPIYSQNQAAKPVTNVQSQQQQQQLLNLFRQPSISAASTGPTASSLGLPSALVELSASPSPSHSRVISEVDTNLTKLPQNQLLNGKVTIKKRPNRPRTATEGKVSATVTGPLNIPQFDKIARRSASPSSPKNAIEKEVSLEQRHVPITILARPVTEHKETLAPTVKVTQSPRLPKAGPQKSPVKVHSLPANSKQPQTQEEKKSAKPFQPQILKRAQPQPQPMRQPIPQAVPSLSSVSLKIATKDLLNLDQILGQGQKEQKPKARAQPSNSPSSQLSPLKVLTNDIQSSEHKTTLLSLFNKPSSATPAPSVFPSPLSDRTVPPGRIDSFPLSSRLDSFPPSLLKADTFPQTAPPSITPLNANSRSRIGSINSVKMSSGRQTPAGGFGPAGLTPSGSMSASASAASPVDKAMLLSYLDGVVREGSK